jgi:hypothetical protein
LGVTPAIAVAINTTGAAASSLVISELFISYSRDK